MDVSKPFFPNLSNIKYKRNSIIYVDEFGFLSLFPTKVHNKFGVVRRSSILRIPYRCLIHVYGIEVERNINEYKCRLHIIFASHFLVLVFVCFYYLKVEAVRAVR